ncbi:MAG: N4-gp56 family major capsid protein [Bacillota bacterium]
MLNKAAYNKLALTTFYVALNLRLFDTQTTLLNTVGNDLSPEMKTYYHDRLIDNAEPKLVHDQFGDKYPIPKNGGKTIEFRKYSPLAKALTKLVEGVTPVGNKLNVTTITATVDQYGDYIQISDMLELTAIDRNLEQSTKLLGSQSGRTLDTVTREVLHGGTNKFFVPSVAADGTETEILLRSSITTLCLLRPEDVKYAIAKLKRMNAEPINGSFVGIIHPDVSCDIQNNNEWVDMHKYARPENIYDGEIGKIGGCRFVETTEAKIIGPADMLGISGYNRTTVSAQVSSAPDVYPVDVFTVAQAAAINAAIGAGTVYKLYIDGTERTVASVVGGALATCKIVLTESISVAAGKTICGTGAGADGTAVYSTLFLGAFAYGVTDIEGMGLQHIVKQLGSAGTADPLNQRATSGWKATKVAERLVEEYMIRAEHSSKKFGRVAVSN